ncbi:hypothetical protein D3C80_487680 [compost metagenome]
MEQAVFKAGTGYFNKVCKLEAALKSTRSNAAIKHFTGFRSIVLGLLALDGQLIAMCFDFKFAFRKACNGHGDAIGVLTGPLNIIWRIGLRTFWRCECIKHRREEAVETNGGTIERGKINVTHM